jgi:uncharacterized NAD(P)/FAD-binding protein YdhS
MLNPGNHQRIGIIGAGFSGAALVATLHKLANQPMEIFLIDKTGQFGTGAAYSTPYHYHLLNVRAKEMSAFEEEPDHFVKWLHAAGHDKTINEQFVPRVLYGNYLKDLLKAIQSDHTKKTTLHLRQANVVDIKQEDDKAQLIFSDASHVIVDKVVLALGNGAPSAFPFPVSDDTACIMNPWQYAELKKINPHDPVLIVGTGLSMIDAVLTLHEQKHQGAIYAVSRHGLLPLPHSNTDQLIPVDENKLLQPLRQLAMHLRKTIQSHVKTGGDWRSIVRALRRYVPEMWASSTLADKKRFLRHVMPYWNIHRHRVHPQLNQLLDTLSARGQLQVLSGHVQSVQDGVAYIRLRQNEAATPFNIKYLINCMGPGLKMSAHEPLAGALVERGLATLDPLQLGFNVTTTCNIQEPSGNASSLLYSLGPPTKGIFWESTAVPDIRQQTLRLAKTLLA